MTDIDLRTAHALLSQIVQSKGRDYTATSPDGDTSCIYGNVVDGVLVPVCIVGHLFAKLGVLGVLMRGDDYLALMLGVSKTPFPMQHGACSIDADHLWSDAKAAGLEFSLEAKQFLRYAQNWQDESEAVCFNGDHVLSDNTWGGALDFAVEQMQARAWSEINRQTDALSRQLQAESVALSLNEPLF